MCCHAFLVPSIKQLKTWTFVVHIDQAQTARNQFLRSDYRSELFPKRQSLDSSKLKELADDNFKLDESGRMFSKWVENTVEKGEIARQEQFLLFLQRFQETCTADM